MITYKIFQLGKAAVDLPVPYEDGLGRLRLEVKPDTESARSFLRVQRYNRHRSERRRWKRQEKLSRDPRRSMKPLDDSELLDNDGEKSNHLHYERDPSVSRRCEKLGWTYPVTKFNYYLGSQEIGCDKCIGIEDIRFDLEFDLVWLVRLAAIDARIRHDQEHVTRPRRVSSHLAPCPNSQQTHLPYGPCTVSARSPRTPPS